MFGVYKTINRVLHDHSEIKKKNRGYFNILYLFYYDVVALIAMSISVHSHSSHFS